MEHSARIRQLLEAKKKLFTDLNDEVWGYAEPRFAEYKSAAAHCRLMESQGFRVKLGLAGEETAFVAEYGEGKPVIAILGEYDALSGLSQEADVAEPKPVEVGGQGHGCGHNTLGAAGAAAATVLKDYMEEKKLPGTIRFYGCPAEENAGGKAFLVRDGFFDDVDIALAYHPSNQNLADQGGSLANFRVFYTFKGTSAHAAGAPHMGRSALDACELMNVGCNYMREHMISEARVHYAYTNVGGTAPNVVQADAQLLYAMRAPTVIQVKELYDRLEKIAKGAAMMTETEVTIRQVAAYSNTIANDVINERFEAYLDEFLPLDYTEEEMDYLRKFQAVIPETEKKAVAAQAKQLFGRSEMAKEVARMPIWNFHAKGLVSGKGSNDVGDVSWVCPTSIVRTACYAAGTTGHHWLRTAQGKSSVCHKGMLLAAAVMACTAVDFLKSPELVAQARENWLDRLGGETYPNPLPADCKPEIW